MSQTTTRSAARWPSTQQPRGSHGWDQTMARPVTLDDAGRARRTDRPGPPRVATEWGVSG